MVEEHAYIDAVTENRKLEDTVKNSSNSDGDNAELCSGAFSKCVSEQKKIGIALG